MSLAKALPAISTPTHSRLYDYSQIAKPRLSTLVLLTTLVGFFFGSTGGMNLWLLLDVLFGTAFVAMGSGALNQAIERHTDKLMRRTADRPLPSGRLSYSEVLYFGVASSVFGLGYLATRVNLECAVVAALTLTLYVFVYTPLKRISSLNTLVGALPGALPPLIGYIAASGTLNWQAYSLFAILFMWQLPHFLAIAWLYRADYSRAGLRMLPNDDPEGVSTGLQIVLHALTLIPISMLPLFFKMAGQTYLIGALALGVMFLATGILFALKRSDAAARKVFIASVIYLPLLLSLMMYDSV